MEATRTFALGSAVTVVKCSACPDAVGKTAKIQSENDDGQFQLNFGRGRPQKDRPKFFAADELALVSETENESA